MKTISAMNSWYKARRQAPKPPFQDSRQGSTDSSELPRSAPETVSDVVSDSDNETDPPMTIDVPVYSPSVSFSAMVRITIPSRLDPSEQDTYAQAKAQECIPAIEAKVAKHQEEATAAAHTQESLARVVVWRQLKADFTSRLSQATNVRDSVLGEEMSSHTSRGIFGETVAAYLAMRWTRAIPSEVDLSNDLAQLIEKHIMTNNLVHFNVDSDAEAEEDGEGVPLAGLLALATRMTQHSDKTDEDAARGFTAGHGRLRNAWQRCSDRRTVSDTEDDEGVKQREEKTRITMSELARAVLEDCSIVQR